MKTLALLLSTLMATTAMAQDIAPGTEQRHWLDPKATPVDLLPPSPITARSVELSGAAARLVHDANTGVWGLPVPRLGDPDYAPENLHYTGKVPETPLTLPARVWAPDGRIDPAAPCILITNGYGIGDKGPESAGAPDSLLQQLVQRGYVGVAVALRQSTGETQDRQVGLNGYYTHYGEDGVAVINEMVRRLGCGMQNNDPMTAKVGMIGASLVGGSQWAVVSRPDYPQALRAIAPDAAGFNAMSYATLWYPGGMLPGPLRVTRPGKELGSNYPAHRDFDAYWAERQMSAGQLRTAASRRLALLMTGGWDEYNTPGNLVAYDAFNALSGPTHKRLVLAPSGHTTPQWLYGPLVIDWMDRWVKGADAKATKTAPAMAAKGDQPPVLLYIRGAERWRAEEAWPVPDAKVIALTLSPQHSGTLASRNDGSLTTESRATGPNATYSYDPAKGPFLTVMLAGNPPAPNTRRLISDMSAQEKAVATWTTKPLDHASEITGTTEISFWAASSTDDADFVASLTQVAPDGTSRQIVQGYLNGPRADYVRIDPVIAPPNPMVPGQFRHVHMRLMSTATVVPKGYRLRLSIAGGADIGIDTDGKPQRGPQGPGKNPQAFTVTIAQTAAMPATLALPILGEPPRL